jgi:molybdenum cofactor cytidylyltransferase
VPAERARLPVAGVVLAAGTSSRMGKNKLLLALRGESLLRRAVRTAVEAGLAPVVVVLGHERDLALTELAGLRCTAVLNPDYQKGINTSLRTGISAVPEEAGAALVMLADMPFVTKEMLEAVVASYRNGAAPLVVSTYQDIEAPPMLYDRSLFPELRALDGEGCGKKVVKRHRGDSVKLAWPVSALTDMDEPADVDAVLAVMGTG